LQRDVSAASKQPDIKDRPFTLPPGEFKPKQSLGQNFLSDQNYVLKIVDSFRSSIKDHASGGEKDGGIKIIEIGDRNQYLVLIEESNQSADIAYRSRSRSSLTSIAPALSQHDRY
jgi:hypothetical protein